RIDGDDGGSGDAAVAAEGVQLARVAAAGGGGVVLVRPAHDRVAVEVPLDAGGAAGAQHDAAALAERGRATRRDDRRVRRRVLNDVASRLRRRAGAVLGDDV